MYSRTRMAVKWEVLDSIPATEAAVAGWDKLAVDANMPFCAPAWLLAWWRYAAPPEAQLRLIAVHDGDRLVGVGPFYAVPWRAGLWTWSLLGTDTTSRIEPLADASSRGRVAQALAEAIARGSPPPGRVRLEGLPLESPWPAALRVDWPARRSPWHHREPPTPSPFVELDEDFDAWLASRSSNFRQQMRRSRRKLDKDGFTFRVASTADEIKADLADFERLHNARWDFRGGSTALTPGTLDMLAEAGRELVDRDRFTLLSLERDGRVISSHLFVAAGDEISYWNGGFDVDFGSYKPSMVALVEALRVGIEQGRRRFDLGPGPQAYKYRFTDEQDLLLWQTLIPPGRRYVASRAAFAPNEARHAIGRRLTREQKRRVRQLLRRAGIRLRGDEGVADSPPP
jgi:CelD/BcsL family acetyltransferase involved in cellulose biosynthesis